MLLDIAGEITQNCFLKCYHINMKFNREETTEKFIHVLCIFGKIFSRHSLIVKMKKASELVGVMKHYLIEPISSLTYVKGDLGYTSLNTITVEEEIELRFHSRFLIGVALMIRKES
ncbi:hypothetical protein T08_7080 [Trichinella sp. T8]|nr:hypothetical protein T08_7080 [Trichinella sp. T8]